MSDAARGRGSNAVPVPIQPGAAGLAAEQAEKIVDALELLPPEKRGMLQSILISQESYSGPIPSPRILAGMETVVPGSAREVIGMAVKQQDFDHSFSTAVLTSESRYRLSTLALAGAVLVGLIGGAIYCATIHETAVAITLGAVGGMSVLAGAIIRGRDLFGGDGTASPERAAAAAKPRAGGTSPKPKPKAKPEAR